jgi:hypothetical protein
MSLERLNAIGLDSRLERFLKQPTNRTFSALCKDSGSTKAFSNLKPFCDSDAPSYLKESRTSRKTSF